MAAVGTVGLSSLAYGVGEVVGGGSAGAAGGVAGGGSGGGAQFTAAPAQSTPMPHHHCPHMGSGSSGSSGTAAPSQDQAPPAAY